MPPWSLAPRALGEKLFRRSCLLRRKCPSCPLAPFRTSLDGAEEQWDLRVALSQGPQAPPLGLYFSIRPQLLPDES